jgi:hypothetical protein
VTVVLGRKATVRPGPPQAPVAAVAPGAARTTHAR